MCFSYSSSSKLISLPTVVDSSITKLEVRNEAIAVNGQCLFRRTNPFLLTEVNEGGIDNLPSVLRRSLCPNAG